MHFLANGLWIFLSLTHAASDSVLECDRAWERLARVQGQMAVVQTKDGRALQGTVSSTGPTTARVGDTPVTEADVVRVFSSSDTLPLDVLHALARESAPTPAAVSPKKGPFPGAEQMPVPQKFDLRGGTGRADWQYRGAYMVSFFRPQDAKPIGDFLREETFVSKEVLRKMAAERGLQGTISSVQLMVSAQPDATFRQPARDFAKFEVHLVRPTTGKPFVVVDKAFTDIHRVEFQQPRAGEKSIGETGTLQAINLLLQRNGLTAAEIGGLEVWDIVNAPTVFQMHRAQTEARLAGKTGFVDAKGTPMDRFMRNVAEGMGLAVGDAAVRGGERVPVAQLTRSDPRATGRDTSFNLGYVLNPAYNPEVDSANRGFRNSNLWRQALAEAGVGTPLAKEMANPENPPLAHFYLSYPVNPR